MKEITKEITYELLQHLMIADKFDDAVKVASFGFHNWTDDFKTGVKGLILKAKKEMI